jgi:psp operon transcriptional activator
LLDRLAFDVITVPPLRERIEDIMPLAYAFAMNMVSELELPLFPGFGARASSALLRHDWPGNVRELKNAVERSVYRLRDKSKQITRIAFDPFDSPFRLREAPAHGTPDPAPEQVRHGQVLPVSLPDRVNAYERELLEAALERARFNQRVASDLLGLTYHQLRGKIRKHQLDVRRPA